MPSSNRGLHRNLSGQKLSTSRPPVPWMLTAAGPPLVTGSLIVAIHWARRGKDSRDIELLRRTLITYLVSILLPANSQHLAYSLCRSNPIPWDPTSLPAIQTSACLPTYLEKKIDP